jgi:hypothetical protein
MEQSLNGQFKDAKIRLYAQETTWAIQLKKL